jgi:hypothetical protein
MNYPTSLLIMVLVIMVGLYFSRIVGGALLISAVFAVACTWRKSRRGL